MIPSYASPVVPPMAFPPTPPLDPRYPLARVAPAVAHQWEAKRAWRLWRDGMQDMARARYYHDLMGFRHGLNFPSRAEWPLGFSQIGALRRMSSPPRTGYGRMPGVRTGGWEASLPAARESDPGWAALSAGPHTGAVWGGGFAEPHSWLAVWARSPGNTWRLVAMVEDLETAELVAARFGDTPTPGYDSAITTYRPFGGQPPPELGTPP